MTHWTAGVGAILLVSLPDVSSAQVKCEAVPAGPARTDCYLGLNSLYQEQSNLAAGKARVQSDAARYRQVTGTSRPKQKHHRSR
jgi:hypothetical protein